MRETIFITGASSGIGRAIAQTFAKRGWNVAATMRNPSDADGMEGPALSVLPLDVIDRASIEAAVAAATDRFGRIDVAVNNAGFAVIGPFEAIRPAQIEQQFAVNVFGLMAVTRAILPHFRAQKGGTFVNIASVVGRFTYPLGTVYDASKFAVEGFSEALRFEMESFGGRVRIIEPGLIASDFGTRSMQFADDPTLEEYRPVVAAMGAMAARFRDLSEPAEVAAEAVWTAVHDPEPTLRYPAGQAAVQTLAERAALDDLTFHARTRARFGL